LCGYISFVYKKFGINNRGGSLYVPGAGARDVPPRIGDPVLSAFFQFFGKEAESFQLNPFSKNDHLLAVNITGEQLYFDLARIEKCPLTQGGRNIEGRSIEARNTEGRSIEGSLSQRAKNKRLRGVYF